MACHKPSAAVNLPTHNEPFRLTKGPGNKCRPRPRGRPHTLARHCHWSLIFREPERHRRRGKDNVTKARHPSWSAITGRTAAELSGICPPKIQPTQEPKPPILEEQSCQWGAVGWVTEKVTLTACRLLPHTSLDTLLDKNGIRGPGTRAHDLHRHGTGQALLGARGPPGG